MLTETREFTTTDIEYLRHGGRGLKLRLFRPAGQGPFKCVVDLHGGAWTKGDLNESQGRGEAMAKAGLALAALDFRHAEDGYPASLVDANYAIRWLKANAAELKLAGARIGISGNSSGGHLAMLAAMRPADPRYAAIPLTSGSAPADARVAAVCTLWPVINPLSRYRYAKRALAGPNPPAWPAGIPERHDTYWKNEAAMADGNPMLALEKGEKVETPPALWIQGRPDPVHDYLDAESGQALHEPERFLAAYRKAGGRIELVHVPQAERAGPASFEPMAAFFKRHL
jgi:acetyl esterase/lipase